MKRTVHCFCLVHTSNLVSSYALAPGLSAYCSSRMAATAQLNTSSADKRRAVSGRHENQTGKLTKVIGDLRGKNRPIPITRSLAGGFCLPLAVSCVCVCVCYSLLLSLCVSSSSSTTARTFSLSFVCRCCRACGGVAFIDTPCSVFCSLRATVHHQPSNNRSTVLWYVLCCLTF
jgi:hypothetical protein